jgi:hypothetical protein
MKRKYFIRIFLGLMCCLLLAPMQSQAEPFVIDDSYNGDNTFWGGQVRYAGRNIDGHTGYGDVIQGARGEFDVDNMTITRSGNSMTVRLQGNYFTNVQNNSSDVSHYGPGDLYISSTGWRTTDPSDPHHTNDVFSLGEGWDYVVSLSGNVYRINSTAAFVDNKTNSDTPGADIFLTNVAPLNVNGYVYRTDQAWRGGYGEWLESATVIYGTDYLEFTFNAVPLSLSTTDFGLHWAARCGNEILEGSDPPAPVPEPMTMLLLSIGLIGVAGIRRKFNS